ncbi:TetR/AcrR family transcriptional regulator, partial [Streptomyces sp. 12257]|uniref:TetR/AcrR family transcriptional regulator n=1 Tax=Streptomyces sp. 12257 TaxID=3041009 RepID=UPI0024A8AD5D
MARPRSFDPDHVLHAAERQFRTTGYNGTSVDDISAATGLGRGSLYAAFDGKHGVLLQAMTGYFARLGQRTPDTLEKPLIPTVATSDGSASRHPRSPP